MSYTLTQTDCKLHKDNTSLVTAILPSHLMQLKPTGHFSSLFFPPFFSIIKTLPPHQSQSLVNKKTSTSLNPNFSFPSSLSTSSLSSLYVVSVVTSSNLW